MDEGATTLVLYCQRSNIYDQTNIGYFYSIFVHSFTLTTSENVLKKKFVDFRLN